MMKQSLHPKMLQVAFVLLLVTWAASAHPNEDFLHCLLHHSENSNAISQIIYTPENGSYLSVLDFYLQNLRFTAPETPKPQLIITPVHESQIQTAIFCSKKHGLQVRIRSGGHDFEGSSSVSAVPFLILDLFNFRSISIDAKTQTGWVGVGATLGELYYAINQVNSSLAFPAGYWPTVGIGGHISGGGYGPLVRKYGLAADHVIDAQLIDVNGRILDRKSMGKDLFWAIRGGIGASFGVILSYRISLVEVPSKVTAFIMKRSLEENATQLVYKWQSVAHKLPADVMLSVELLSVNSTQSSHNRTIQATFHCVFLGEVEGLLPLMEEHFPELDVSKKDCKEMSWVEYFAYYLGLPTESTAEMLQSRIPPAPKVHFKSKSDFVQEPIPFSGLEEIWNMFYQIDGRAARMEWTPLGGRMDEIHESEIPFPHRTGNSFIIYKKVQWHEMDKKLSQQRITWIRKLHSLMGKFVSKNPRCTYANYRDFDLGMNNLGRTSVQQARVWGVPYFKKNFYRLVKVKTMVDPKNFFRNEQSIPPFAEL